MQNPWAHLCQFTKQGEQDTIISYLKDVICIVLSRAEMEIWTTEFLNINLECLKLEHSLFLALSWFIHETGW